MLFFVFFIVQFMCIYLLFGPNYLGLRGVSILFSSGDSGVGSNCNGGPFVPEYPTDSPWVTSVGATVNTSPETVAGFSGGGFSNRWPQPSWQNQIVSNYLTNTPGVPNAKYYNASGRAYPDVSAQGRR